MTSKNARLAVIQKYQPVTKTDLAKVEGGKTAAVSGDTSKSAFKSLIGFFKGFF